MSKLGGAAGASTAELAQYAAANLHIASRRGGHSLSATTRSRAELEAALERTLSQYAEIG